MHFIVYYNPMVKNRALLFNLSITLQITVSLALISKKEMNVPSLSVLFLVHGEADFRHG